MARIETNPEQLQRILADLAALRAGSLSAAQAEALAECAFRIAVHVSTPVARAVELLQLAMRTDPSNPRYPYHMARLYFRNGDLRQAGVWLNHARKLCPTSHRIWTHIGLLQREVNETHNLKYREKKGYLQDEHRHRWKEIADAIQKGQDQFSVKLARFEPDLDQKESPETERGYEEEPSAEVPEAAEEAVERLTNAGVCRWSRIGDLMAEDLLEADAGPRTRDALRSLLESAAAKAASRVGGGALFAILGIEWMVRGYSPEFIRRIRPAALEGSRAGDLLEDVLRIFEMPADALPSAIAAALDEDRIPPSLAAAIHRQSVFGPPLNPARLIADLRESRAAERQGSDEDCAKWLQTLGEHRTSLERKPFAPVADFPPESQQRDASPEEVLAKLGNRLQRTEQDAKSFRTWLDAHKSKTADSFLPEEIAEVGKIRDFVKALQSIKQDATVELKRLRDSGNAQALADAIQEIENGFQNITPRVLSMLLNRAPFKAVPDAPTAEVTAPKPAEVTSAEPSADGIAEIKTLRQSPAELASPENGPDTRSVRTKLVDAIEGTEAKLIGVFDSQAQSLAVYNEAVSGEPALQALHMSVDARKADVLFRLNKRSEARRELAALLKEDIFDLRLLRNLAIVDTIDGDVQRYQTSWRNYVEMLYFQAAALQDVTWLASERETIHQNYGNSYGLKDLYEDKAEQKTDPEDLIAFISSPARVRLYIRHQMLAIFNRRLQFRTAPAVLGVDRSAPESAREQAFEKMKNWSSELCSELPQRAGARFSEAVTRNLHAAAQEMKSAKRLRELAGQTDYQEERTKYMQWIANVFMWKVRIHNLILTLPKFSGQAGFLDFLVAFAEVDSIPLDTWGELLETVALQRQTRPNVVSSLLANSPTPALIGVLGVVFPPHGKGEPGSDDQRKALYAKLTGELASSRLIGGLAGHIIDNPGNVEELEFYPPNVVAVLNSQSPDSDDLTWMQHAHQLYPKSGGISYHYALLLAYAQDFAGARRVATEGVSLGLREGSRKQCQDILAQLSNARGQPA